MPAWLAPCIWAGFLYDQFHILTLVFIFSPNTSRVLARGKGTTVRYPSLAKCDLIPSQTHESTNRAIEQHMGVVDRRANYYIKKDEWTFLSSSFSGFEVRRPSPSKVSNRGLGCMIAGVADGTKDLFGPWRFAGLPFPATPFERLAREGLSVMLAHVGNNLPSHTECSSILALFNFLLQAQLVVLVVFLLSSNFCVSHLVKP